MENRPVPPFDPSSPTPEKAVFSEGSDWLRPGPDPLDEERRRLIDFRNRLYALTPRTWVTQLLVAINVAVFLLMITGGVSIVSPGTDDLVRWGANFGPRTLAGERWRLLTSAFVHIGVLHIALNMWALWVVGKFVERLLGNIGYLLVYLLSAVAGSMASVAWHPQVLSAGASGAVFGVYGALLGFVIPRRHCIPPTAFAQLRGVTLSVLGYNLLFGFLVPGIDNAAHLGGLIAGLLGGLLLSHPLDPTWRRARWLRTALLAVVGPSVLAALAQWLPPPPMDLQSEQNRFAAVELKCLNAYYQLAKQYQAKKIDSRGFADQIEHDILPRWEKERDRVDQVVATLRHPDEFWSQVAPYMNARQRQWQSLVAGLREEDLQKIEQSRTYQKEADRLRQALVNSR